MCTLRLVVRQDDPRTRTAVASGGSESTSQQSRTELRSELELESESLPRRMGRYELLLKLARGGMGVVYAGRLVGRDGFDRLVAIKVLAQADTNEKEREAFFTEARLAARLAHPNVVATLDQDEDRGVPFIVMELVRGMSLGHLIRRLDKQQKKLPVPVAAWILVQTAAGLHAAHELKGPDGTPLHLVHRDVSPQNIMLSYEGRVYVTDFGVAKLAHAERPTTKGMVKGKLAYMSPEQARGGPLDRRSDVFALGILLHEALTGMRLFAGETPAERVMRVIQHQPPPPSHLRESVPDSISDVAMICLRKDSGERFPTAEAVATALRVGLRTEGLAVDETDVAALMQDAFYEEKRALEWELDRVRTTAAKSGSFVATEPTEPSETATNVTSDTTTRARSSKLPLVLVGFVGLAILAAALIGGWRAAFSPEMAEPPTEASSQPEEPRSAIPLTSTRLDPADGGQDTAPSGSASAKTLPKKLKPKGTRWKRPRPRPTKKPPSDLIGVEDLP